MHFSRPFSVFLIYHKHVTTYLNTITSLDLLSYATYNATQEQLAEYGLDKPELSVTVNYTYTDAASDEETQIPGTCIIHIGRSPEELAAAEEAEAKGETPKKVSAYVRIGDSQIVYNMDSVDYGILSDAAYDDLRHKNVFWGSFEDVTRIDISLEGADHVLNSELDDNAKRSWYYQTAEAHTQIDGHDLEDAPEALDISDFKSSLKALCANSFTTEEPTEKEEIRLVLHLDNETYPTIEVALYRYSGSECLAEINGESVSLIPRASVMELVEIVQAIVLDNR